MNRKYLPNIEISKLDIIKIMYIIRTWGKISILANIKLNQMFEIISIKSDSNDLVDLKIQNIYNYNLLMRKYIFYMKTSLGILSTILTVFC